MSVDRHSGLFATVCLCSVVLLAGCTDFKRAIGLEKVSPDEFAVEARAPLTIPPDFDLRPPQPGVARPQESSMASKAQGAIDSAGPGDPGKQEAGVLKFPGASASRLGGDANQQAGDQSFANNLLQFNGAGAAIEKRETSPIKVY
jgi:hypothetical protein